MPSPEESPVSRAPAEPESRPASEHPPADTPSDPTTPSPERDRLKRPVLRQGRTMSRTGKPKPEFFLPGKDHQAMVEKLAREQAQRWSWRLTFVALAACALVVSLIAAALYFRDRQEHAQREKNLLASLNPETPSIDPQPAMAAVPPPVFARYREEWQAIPESERPAQLPLLFARATAEPTSDPAYWIAIAELCQKSRELLGDDAALPLLDKFYAKAQEFARGNPIVLEKVSDHLMARGQIAEATDLLRQAAQAAAPPMSVLQKYLFALASTGGREESIGVARQIAKRQPGNPQAWAVLAEIAFEQDRMEEALLALDFALALNPSDAHLTARKVNCLIRLGRHAEALTFAEKAQRVVPNTPGVSYLTGLALLANKNYNAAYEVLSRLESEHRTNASTVNEPGLYHSLAVAADHTGRKEKAEEYYRRAIELSGGKNADAANNLAYLWLTQGKHPEEAGALIRQALAVKPDHPPFLDTLGLYQLQTGQPEASLVTLEKALSLSPSPEAEQYEHLGDALAALGRKKEAAEKYQRAGTLAPENRRIADKMRALKY